MQNKASPSNLPPYPHLGRRFLAKSDGFRLGAVTAKSTFPQEFLFGLESGNGYTIHNEILLSLPTQE